MRDDMPRPSSTPDWVTNHLDQAYKRTWRVASVTGALWGLAVTTAIHFAAHMLGVI